MFRRRSQVLHLLAGLATIFVSGCTALQPLDLPPEFTHPPADAPLWHELDTIRQDDWQVSLNVGVEALDWRLRAIDSATDSIDLQTFLWHFDTVGSLVLDHLVKAADRGVLVRILIDDTFLAGEDSVLLALHEHTNIEYRVYNPFKRRSGGLLTRQILNAAEFHRLDHRMHNKAMVVDNRIAIVGGRNLGDEYFGVHTDTNFRDMELLMGGPIVSAVAKEFDTYWNDHWSFPIDVLAHVQADPVELEELRHTDADTTSLHREETVEERHARWTEAVSAAFGGKPTLYADRPPEGRPEDPAEAPVQVANELIELFDSAEHDITIVSAYLIPTPHLEGAIDRAVDRGVSVNILTNSIRSNNHLAAHSAYRNHIRTLMENGAELHEVRVDAASRPRYMLLPTESKLLALHAKGLLIDDDRVFIGSANLDPRSLRINTEMGILIESTELNAALRDAVLPDFDLQNAWHLRFDEQGRLTWVSDTAVLTAQPAASFMQRIEDWLFAHLPIEGEM